MGEVYRARDTRLLRDIALKILPESFTAETERVRRFEQEAHAVAALNHPNIISIFDIGSQGQTHYIVSELLEGQTLRDSIPASGMPMRRAVEFAIQIANGLAAAHDQGIVHRDLKPENIFVTRDGRVKILDFGLAKLRKMGATSETLTSAEAQVGQVLGTFGYMSPEQVKREPADHRSDIFSFGSIFYEMLTGQRAFKRNTGAETMTAILNEEAPDLTAKTGPLPATLERIVRHCMEKQPSRRFQSAQASRSTWNLCRESRGQSLRKLPQKQNREGKRCLRQLWFWVRYCSAQWARRLGYARRQSRVIPSCTASRFAGELFGTRDSLRMAI
jgi:serine/threonine protein kinase